ncbi:MULTISPECIES: LysR family transcriptional regulator [Aneurinibacillus]|jgi:LysR family hydrogen peroxide-inducible transcriptional activator|uniref:LysR family transcriptional regulator n=1 Tax=Aneurinibacillus thermoaerophilus TaxID=143495 RepID=A0A1G7X9E9_ANETH|nr:MULTISPECIES: LysR family transcriptional regulator [Aneurinibacillus]AMA73270.1 transcriptional regulator [Aneurinibacillus sp. XH2]MED0674296.1 LysR family transcriptional regulator [Aneurinibacillus thermoaerophilus]MED0678314.1 LysR family transcriptional regulator [Aneurinibacillus thermoaerophilus]MED0736160.1 LysR family transcriptional regulator [Aneurinibacillus thermoaerophilus]MED0757006.1 LysR family transcriptional regulator [Aneurinibacillus thermoaerophilus]
MEFRQLLYAVTIAEEKSFSKAAEKLHLAQPSLSQQIAKLEKELDVILFERSSSTRLTDAGERFYESATRILDAVEQLKKEMQDMVELEKGTLTVGSLPITGAHILPLVLPVFKRKYPGIQVRLVEEPTLVLEQLTARGTTEMSLLSLPIQEPNLEWEPILEEEICLAVPPDHPLSRRKEVEIRELNAEAFIMLKKGQGFRTLAAKWCEEAGFVPQVVFESSNIETVQSLVAAGMGIAFVPRMITRFSKEEMLPVYVSLRDPTPRRTLVIAYRRGRYRSRASRAFLSTVKEVLREMEQSFRRF